MVKKVLLVSAGAFVVFALIFGRSGFSYVSTSLSELRNSVRDSVPVEFQIKNARDEIQKLDPEIHEMMREIAKEELEVENLRDEVRSQQSSLDTSFTHIMLLKNHLESSDSYFVYDGESYSVEQVKSELRRRFENHKTKTETHDSLKQVLAAREAGLEAARQQLEETRLKKHELEVRVENLEAQARMVEVAKTASDLNFDNSRISRTQELLDDIESRIAVEKTIVDVQETNIGGIPLEREESGSDDITEEIEVYFGGGASDFVNN